MAGMVAGLDPWSHFEQSPTEPAGRMQVGVGLEVVKVGSEIKVVTSIEGSPAFRAGLKGGDVVTRIGHTHCAGMSVRRFHELLRGEPDTSVLLTVLRASEGRSFPIELLRGATALPSVRARFVEPGYAWLRIGQFHDGTVKNFARTLKDLVEQQPDLKGLVLDLRNGPGGSLEDAAAVAGAFLPDVVIAHAQGRSTGSEAPSPGSLARGALRGTGDPVPAWRGSTLNVPLVVLVNEGSAFASELVAGALQDHGRATIMGATTYGGGSGQTTWHLGPGTALTLTTERYLTPSGRPIAGQGIVPDVMLDETAEGMSFPALGTCDAAPAATPAASTGEPEFGSAEDFRLAQAIRQLKGEPVMARKDPG
jgi:carboxyl-terminal processing protease